MDVVGKARRRTDHLVATLVSLAVLIALADPTAAAAPTGCRVRNLDTGALQTSLQAAVDAASPGQHLMLKGTCHGTTSIDKDVSVRGIRTTRPGGPTLDGDGKGTVLTVRRVTVLLEDLTIEGGMALRGSVPKGRRYGGGITNRGGTLTLRDVVVRGNRGLDGGGIFNAGTLVLDGATQIIGNRSWGGGGGIYNTGTLTLDATSRVSRNHWGGITNRGDLTLNGESTVSANPEWQAWEL